ncbi:MAG: YopX family protein [Acholeplasmataceae bacterium]
MRNIKFRAWLPEQKKHVDVKALDWNEKGEIITLNYPEGKEYYSNGLFDDFIIEQYTGSVDTKGIEIYEGDIIMDSEFVYIVIYDDNEACFKIKDANDGSSELFRYLSPLNTWARVIGHIHEKS